MVCALACAVANVDASPRQATPPPVQQVPATVPASQTAVAPLAPISAPEIDALAADLAPLIAKQHLSMVAVFGAIGPNDRITPLGLPIGDAFSEALAKRAQGFQVIDRSELRATLKQQQVAEKMLSSDVLAAWISSLVKADGIAIVKLEDFSPPKVTVAVFFQGLSKKDFKLVATRRIQTHLEPGQAETIQKTLDTPITREWHLPPGVDYPKCVYCPRPDYAVEARKADKQGDEWLQTTVNEEGQATEIEVTTSLGYGLDAKAVQAVQKWRFKPATDSNGNPVSAVTHIQVQFQLFRGPYKPPSDSPSSAPNKAIPLDIVRVDNSKQPTNTPPDPKSYPACIYCPRPNLTDEAKKKKINGDVWLEAFVSADGKVGDVKVTKSLGYGLDEEAIKAVKGWRFRPAVDSSGKPVGQWTSIQIQFQIFN